MEWFYRLPSWARQAVIVAVATAMATYIIATWLPSPITRALDAHAVTSERHAELLARAMEEHVRSMRQWEGLLRQICANTAKSSYESGRCMGRDWAVLP